MPLYEQSPEERELERQEELEDRDWAAEREDVRRQHELTLARAKAAIPQRHKTIVRIGVAIAKLPALAILAAMLPILTLTGKELPKPLCDFLVV